MNDAMSWSESRVFQHQDYAKIKSTTSSITQKDFQLLTRSSKKTTKLWSCQFRWTYPLWRNPLFSVFEVLRLIGHRRYLSPQLTHWTMGPTKSDAKKTAPKLVDYGTFKLGLHNMIMSCERRRLTHCSGNLMTTHAEERQRIRRGIWCGAAVIRND